VKAKERRKLKRRRRRIEKRLARTNLPARAGPVFRSSNVVYEVSERTSATASGGVGAAHVLAKKLGLTRAIDGALHLLKMHLPYHPKAGRCAANRTT
jgi:hypothetical protein